MPNHLIHETSPYLLQHAHNPVNWYPWNEETLSLAQRENKLILVSIGYSACHWCHVMEQECFEDDQVAAIMNQSFINIKIDREERPDIDMVYMGAVQLMTGQGGWPLNCITLPNGQPIYGGTYFPKQQWIEILKNLANLYQTEPDKVYEYAQRLTQGLEKLELPKDDSALPDFNIDTLRKSVKKWKLSFDSEYGGPNRAPKFPLPNNYLFLLMYNHFEKDESLQNHINLTLTKMASGGIYDQLAGGFARYSVDAFWKVPHFEKMLYDNAQLITLYSQAYKQQANPLYKNIVYETIEFVQKEFLTSNGGFYAALDADSDGVEGKYYVWQKDELKNILKDNYELFADYFCVNHIGYWEEDKYILLRNEADETLAKKHNLSVDELQQTIKKLKTSLLLEREKRVKPRLDNKIIASWNGLMCTALSEAYLVFNDESFRVLAVDSANFLAKNFVNSDGSLFRIKNPSIQVSGFLEDYAFVIEAFLNTHLITANEIWLKYAKQMCDYALRYFYDSKAKTFFFTNSSKEQLIVRKAEWSDNVIPASSSQMAINLYKLSVIFTEPSYYQVSKDLLLKVITEIEHYGSGYSNWGILLLWFVAPKTEIAITGNCCYQFLQQIYSKTSPFVVFNLTEQESNLPLLQHRYINEQIHIYVCHNNHCLLPVHTVKNTLELLNTN